MNFPLSGENIACIRGERLVFSGLGFSAKAGGVLLLKGKNGSGKTSLLRLMAGLAVPDEGIIKYRGQDYLSDPVIRRTSIHYVGHYEALKPALTVGENLSFWARLYGGGEINRGLNIFGLGKLAKLPVQFLSAGQRRRLALARLAVMKAEIWLLDEPSVALDTPSLDVLRQLIWEHQTSGGTVIVSTHMELDLRDAVTLEMSKFGAEKVVKL